MDLMTLAAKITLDAGEYNQGVKNVEKSGKELAGKLTARTIALGHTLGDFASSAIRKVGNLTMDVFKKSYKAFAEYEQLVGGIETIFKKDLDPNAYYLVMENAQKAFKTTGQSANEYMETVTAFAASLLQGLGGDTYKAAEVADMAMQDMSDNANKMGSSMESIENAYKGFAKQNYTMLDNLKLGYGGTRQEMERLLKDAGKLTGKKYNISNLADVYEAIHAIQTEMGITGTTSKEASSTVEGSTKMMKASWENLLIAMGSGKNVKKATKDFVSSVKVMGKNAIPVVKEIMSGLGEGIDEVGRELFGKDWDITINWIQNAWDSVKTAFGIAAEWVGNAYQVTVKWIQEKWKLVSTAFDLAAGWADKEFKTTIQWAQDAWDTISSQLEEFGKWAGKTFDTAIKWGQETWDSISNELTEFGKWAGKKYKSTIKWVSDQWDNLGKNIRTASSWAGKTKQAIVEWVQKAWDDVSNAFNEAGKWANKAFQTTINWVKGTTKSVTDFMASIPKAINVAVNFIANAGGDIVGGLTEDLTGSKDMGDIGKKLWGLMWGFGQAKGDWNVPYDNYPSLLHRGEMVLTKSQARQLRNGNLGNGTSEIVGALESVRNDLQNMRLVVGQRVFGRTVVDYGGRRLRDYIGNSDSRLAAGYGAG